MHGRPGCLLLLLAYICSEYSVVADKLTPVEFNFTLHTLTETYSTSDGITYITDTTEPLTDASSSMAENNSDVPSTELISSTTWSSTLEIETSSTQTSDNSSLELGEVIVYVNMAQWQTCVSCESVKTWLEPFYNTSCSDDGYEKLEVVSQENTGMDTAVYHYHVLFNSSDLQRLENCVNTAQKEIWSSCNQSHGNINPQTQANCSATASDYENSPKAVNATISTQCSQCNWNDTNLCSWNGSNTCLYTCDLYNACAGKEEGIFVYLTSSCNVDPISYQPVLSCSCTEEFGSLGVFFVNDTTCQSLSGWVTIICGLGGLLIVLVVILAGCLCHKTRKTREKDRVSVSDGGFHRSSRRSSYEAAMTLSPDNVNQRDTNRIQQSSFVHFPSNSVDNSSLSSERQESRNYVVSEYDNKAFEQTTYQDEMIADSAAYRAFQPAVYSNAEALTEYKFKRPQIQLWSSSQFESDSNRSMII